MIRHILLIKFKAQTSHTQIEKLMALFISMTKKVDGVIDVEWGENNSPEGKHRGYTHAVVMTFSGESARERYLPHPEHSALKHVFRPILEEIIVFDYSPMLTA